MMSKKSMNTSDISLEMHRRLARKHRIRLELLRRGHRISLETAQSLLTIQGEEPWIDLVERSNEAFLAVYPPIND